MSVDFVATSGGKFQVQRQDGSVVSEHSSVHVALETAANESQQLGGTLVYVRQNLEYRVVYIGNDVSVDPPDPEPEPSPPPSSSTDPIFFDDFEDPNHPLRV